jgi:ABC-type lipoprotein release transport system permease subunit
VLVVLLLAATIAASVPAYRATRIDPVSALTRE